MMMRKTPGQGLSKDMLRVQLVREQMDKQIEDRLIFIYYSGRKYSFNGPEMAIL